MMNPFRALATISMMAALLACNSSDNGASPNVSPDGAILPIDGGPEPVACSVDAGSTGVPSCDTCTEARCCGERTTCFGDKGCVDYITCARGCVIRYQDGGVEAGIATRNCVVSCDQSGYDAAVMAQAWTDCVHTKCKAECP